MRRRLLRYARAILATDPAIAAERFEDALSADLARWPFQRARLLAAYGRWLRRERRVAESRPPLRAARKIFDTPGCGSWADQARRELRASGESGDESPENGKSLVPYLGETHNDLSATSRPSSSARRAFPTTPRSARRITRMNTGKTNRNQP